MISYCLKCKKKTESKTEWLSRQKDRRILLISNCAVCGSKNSRFIKEQKVSGLLNS